MKFNCGLSREAKIRKEKELFESRAACLVEWHNWFAWIPTRVDENDCRWLETIERKYEEAFWFDDFGEGWLFNAQFRAKQPKASP